MHGTEQTRQRLRRNEVWSPDEAVISLFSRRSLVAHGVVAALGVHTHIVVIFYFLIYQWVSCGE